MKSRTKKIGVGIALAVIALVSLIAIPNYLEYRKHKNETSAIESLWAIEKGQSLFREKDLEGDGKQDYGSLTELGAAGLIDAQLASGTKQGYTFAVGVPPQTAEFLWMGVANPIAPGSTGERCFAKTHEGVTFYTSRGPIALTPDARIPPGPMAGG